MRRSSFLLALVAGSVAHAQTITEYRWWINDDISTLNAAAVGPDAVLTLITDLDMPALIKDYNTITLQFKDSDGRYGAPYTMPFTRGTGVVNGHEWWIDDAIADRTSGTNGPDNVVDLIADLPMGVASGDHVFTIRFSGASGTWSVPLTTAFSFFTALEELPGVTDLLLFPNPATDELGLRITTDVARVLNLQVLDLSGAAVRDLRSWAASRTGYRNWDISDLAAGSYLLRISDGTGVRNLPFVKP